MPAKSAPQTATDYQAVHAAATVIDATCPLMNQPEFIDWWITGGVTVAAPTIGGYEPSGPTMTQLARWVHRVKTDPRLMLVTQGADIAAAKASGKLGIVFHMQGTDPLDADLNLIDVYKRLGIGMIQLTYNVKNRVGDGCEERTDAGLSNFGVAAIERMNENRIIVDCSHTGYRTTMDAIARSTAPVVFSHANARAVHPSPRNITDEQIAAVAATGGLVGVVGFPAFVSQRARPTLDDLIDHIDHMVGVAGIDHVGIGIDYFTGQAGVVDDASAQRIYDNAVNLGMWRAEAYPPPPYHYPAGIETPRTFPNLTRRLLERGYDVPSTEKILGGNWVRVFTAVWG